MKCGKSAGVVSSKPILHATPGSFVAHSNDRNNKQQLKRSFREVNPTLASGTCAHDFYPFKEDLRSMRNGPLSHTWKLFEPKTNVTKEVRSIWLMWVPRKMLICSPNFHKIHGLYSISTTVWNPSIPTVDITYWYVAMLRGVQNKSYPTEASIPVIRIVGAAKERLMLAHR